MATTYTKSLITDFGGVLDSAILHADISADPSISPSILSISTGDPTTDTVKITFDAALDAGEQTVLDTLISNHAPDPIIVDFLSKTLSKTKHRGSQYSRAGIFIYPGRLEPVISNIKTISYQDAGVTSYSIRVTNATNDQIIAEATFSNTEIGVCDLGVISNIPNTNTPIEVHVKRNGGVAVDKIYIESISFYK